MEETFHDFLFGYVAAGHTMDTDANDELNRLTKEFINWLDPGYIFTETATETYIEFLDEKMSETNRHFFVFRFDRDRYVRHLENWIRHLINDKKNTQ